VKKEAASPIFEVFTAVRLISAFRINVVSIFVAEVTRLEWRSYIGLIN
jgi:hypothetical protein